MIRLNGIAATVCGWTLLGGERPGWPTTRRRGLGPTSSSSWATTSATATCSATTRSAARSPRRNIDRLGDAGDAVHRRALEFGRLLAVALHAAHRPLSLAHAVAARASSACSATAADRAGPADHRRPGEAARLPHRVRRQVAPRLGLADPRGASGRCFQAAASPAADGEVVADGRPEASAGTGEVFSQPIAGGPTTRGFDSTSAPTCPTGRRTASSRTTARVGIPSEFLPARLLGHNQASLQGPALAGLEAGADPARAGRPRWRRSSTRAAEAAGTVLALPAADRAAHAAGRRPTSGRARAA